MHCLFTLERRVSLFPDQSPGSDHLRASIPGGQPASAGRRACAARAVKARTEGAIPPPPPPPPPARRRQPAAAAAAAAGTAVRPRREAWEGAPPVGSRRRLAVVCPRLPAPRTVRQALYWTLQGDNRMRNDPLQKVFAAEGGRQRSQSVMMVQWVL
ncbi:coiled-coil domain-containing protein 71L-like [Ursus arctos]|uniref:coiled-coil domain-containing protein 71L-like n=1 Tax=Ursus arctos TaxID=9644 RepID=UPI002547D362|nr:coiled-coil domain-containing protein 71L-like [Ursus arctos]